MVFIKNIFLLFLSVFFCLGFIVDIDAANFESTYFKVTLPGDIDMLQLMQALQLKAHLHLDTLYNDVRQDMHSLLKDELDELYLEVSDILDIHLYSLQISLHIVTNHSELEEVLAQSFDISRHPSSFYHYEKNTIYVSQEKLTLGVLAHEVAHAVVSHYFVVPPPVKVQEVLCGYVEYSITKKNTPKINTNSKIPN